MSKITKNQRINQIADQLARQQGVISKLTIAVKEQNEAILMLEKLTDEKLRDQPEPQLKQLTQSVFDGLDEKWRFAAVDGRTKRVYVYEQKPYIRNDEEYWRIDNCLQSAVGHHYDTTDWQNSLIERDITKELTGSDLARAMLARGDKYVMCLVSDKSEHVAIQNEILGIVTGTNSKDLFTTSSINAWVHVVPINNQGEPLTAAEAGF